MQREAPRVPITSNITVKECSLFTFGAYFKFKYFRGEVINVLQTQIRRGVDKAEFSGY